jgi:ribonuclease Z
MNFDITILGSNSATFAYGRHQTSQLLTLREHCYLIDCGEGTQLQLARYKQRAMRITHVFITHLHGDHYLGLTGLIMTMQLNGREAPLHIFGPRGLEDLITLQLRLADTRLQFPCFFTAVAEGPTQIIHEDAHLEVHTIPLQHRITCNGYLFKERSNRRRILAEKIQPLQLAPAQIAQLRAGQPALDAEGMILANPADTTLPPFKGRSYAFCSDTIFLPELAEQLRGVDMLYHESTFLHERADRAAQTYHTTALQAGQLAADAGIGKLLLGHFSSRYRDLVPLLEEARSAFANTFIAEEGQTYQIPYGDKEDNADGQDGVVNQKESTDTVPGQDEATRLELQNAR